MVSSRLALKSLCSLLFAGAAFAHYGDETHYLFAAAENSHGLELTSVVRYEDVTELRIVADGRPYIDTIAQCTVPCEFLTRRGPVRLDIGSCNDGWGAVSLYLAWEENPETVCLQEIRGQITITHAGVQGPQGIQGPRGEQGPQGVKGETGDRGPRGFTGANGAQGVPGETGPAGPRGPRGLQGIQGDKGDTGERGPRGYAGSDGRDGADGKDGTTITVNTPTVPKSDTPIDTSCGVSTNPLWFYADESWEWCDMSQDWRDQFDSNACEVYKFGLFQGCPSLMFNNGNLVLDQRTNFSRNETNCAYVGTNAQDVCKDNNLYVVSTGLFLGRFTHWGENDRGTGGRMPEVVPPPDEEVVITPPPPPPPSQVYSVDNCPAYEVTRVDQQNGSVWFRLASDVKGMSYRWTFSETEFTFEGKSVILSNTRAYVTYDYTIECKLEA